MQKKNIQQVFEYLAFWNKVESTKFFRNVFVGSASKQKLFLTAETNAENLFFCFLVSN